MKTKCEYCNKELSTKNIKRHQKDCTNKNHNETPTCKFCGDEKINFNSLLNHERLCKLNPDRQYTPFQDINFQQSPVKSNQFKKAKLEGRELKFSEEAKRKISEASKRTNGNFSEESNAKRIATINKKIEEGNWHFSISKRKIVEYKGTNFDSGWEVLYAKFLDENQIKWERNTLQFQYTFEGKNRKYFPDFYLPETKEFIEIKGFKRPRDEAKWSQFPKDLKLKVLLKNDLKALGLKV